MLSDKEKAELNSRLNSLKEESDLLNSELKAIKEKREASFVKKEALSKEINALISQIRNTKGHNDQFSKVISDLKSQRDSYNKKVRELIARIKEMRSKRNALSSEGRINIDGIKKQIGILEHSIEINAYTYDKEKKVSEKIKRLRKIYKENADVAKLDDELRQLSSEIDSTKKTADELHSKLEETIHNSRSENSSFMELAKKISLLKQQQKDEFEAFKKFKAEYVEKINKFKEKTNEARDIRSKLFSDKKEKFAAENDVQKRELRRKAETVKEKLTKKGTITKEDILILQHAEEN